MDPSYQNWGNGSPKSPKRIRTPASHRLSVILESSDARVARGREGRRGMFGGADIRESLEGSNESSNGKESKLSSDLENIRNNKHVTRRGGWRRLLLIILVVIVLAIALGVGLGVGLRNRNKPMVDDSQEEESPAVPESPSNNNNFPIGTYSIPSFLASVETGCTSNPATWTCFPFKTFGDDPSGSTAWFNWEIKSGSGPDNLRISSTNDPLHITFTDVEMTLSDKGMDSEHFTFRTTTTKEVQPRQLTDDNALVSCYFNSTIFQASLYTKEAKTFPAEGQEVPGVSYEEWPFRVVVEEVASGGENTPNCYKKVNGVIGERITDGITPQDAGNQCSCQYKNWQ